MFKEKCKNLVSFLALFLLKLWNDDDWNLAIIDLFFFENKRIKIFTSAKKCVLGGDFSPKPFSAFFYKTKNSDPFFLARQFRTKTFSVQNSSHRFEKFCTTKFFVQIFFYQWEHVCTKCFKFFIQNWYHQWKNFCRKIFKFFVQNWNHRWENFCMKIFKFFPIFV
jgi:hypothetical protein